ncbi:DJ-1/PfpI family protein [Stieleria varia]|uniref:DJ-1/PfpI family protein n=1 Tax=Stieleria varia TaxID=2528005 RepID=A0A5C5ZTB3_9BACT|nr:DJ-1/PfpI family protein [Stieleria varia]TWT89443.1 DJ-1/PfpI family protein [Stieleria varia]
MSLTRSLYALVPITCLCMMHGLASRVAAEDKSANWIDLIKTVDISNGSVAGNWQRSAEAITTDATAGSRITLPYRPSTEYDFRVSFTRTSGVHSVALMFVVGRGQATFEVDAWGQHLAGLQMINGQSIQNNPTRVDNQTLENGRRYEMRVEVRKGHVRAFLDDRLIAQHPTDGSDLSVPDVWRMPDQASLGIGAYSAATTFHSIDVRPVSEQRLAANNIPTSPPMRTRDSDTVNSAANNSVATSSAVANRSTSGRTPATGKRVLLVIANQDFFYREYGDPRAELERAGITVEVAAARKQICRPHANSGQQGDGSVMPDLAIGDVDPSRYDAILFSGGWGSSMYQFAFTGSYANQAYNGDSRTKAAVNRLINEFVDQDKYVGALCHGVSVLAWSRVDGKSVLNGKRAVGSPRQSPAGTYNGRRDQPLSRWNAEVNGARLSPARSIGDPRTSADDVVVDGKIITGEDDSSAKLFGQTVAQLLTKS